MKDKRIKIIEFYGRECIFTVKINPAVAKLAEEEPVEIEQREFWHNEENERIIESIKYLYDKECRGNIVSPSFYEPEEKRLVCNPGSYEELKTWALQSCEA